MTFKKLEREWYEKLKQTGFDDIESPRGQLRVDIHPHYRALAFIEYDIRTHYVEIVQTFLWDYEFESERHRQIWTEHVDGVPIRKIGEKLGLTRNQVWPVVRKLREKAKVKYMDSIAVREYRSNAGEDYEFVKATWLNSYKHSSQFAKRIKHSVFYFHHGRVIDSILARARVIVATLPDEPDVILGYIVVEQSTIHYVFVKDDWRKLGIARRLYTAADLKPSTTLNEIFFTHWTDPVDSLINNKTLKGLLVYDPYRI